MARFLKGTDGKHWVNLDCVGKATVTTNKKDVTFVALYASDGKTQLGAVSLGDWTREIERPA